MDLLCFILVSILVFIASYWFLTRTFDHWKEQNVPSMPNPIPGFGHLYPVIALKENMPSFVDRIYKYANASIVGFYFLQKPGIVVRDPELIKNILQTNFTSFSSNALQLNEKADVVLAKNPFFTRDLDLWKIRRSRVVNHLSGKKLRHLFIIIQGVSSKLSDYVDRKITENGNDFECELKDHFIKYTGEIVANAAFAIEGQSFDDHPDQLSFANITKTIFEPTTINGIKQALLFYLPSIGNLFGISFLPSYSYNYFKENMKAIIKKRKLTNTAPSDYLQFCIDANSENDLDSVIGDVITFYADVYETSSTTLAVLFYYLSQNEKIQEKLRTHLNDTLQPTNGEITYESLKNMNYLDQVLYEAMRLTPPLGVMLKMCTENITLEGSDGLKCRLEPGNLVFIPVLGLNSDSNYWTNPEVFDPERFSPEQQADRHKFVFLPFGEGPRMCLGMRLAVMLVKLAAATLLTRFSIEHSQKTKVPFEMEPTSFLTYVKGGLWAKFKKLNRNS